jgi:Tol biopolymer transport system component
MRPPQFAGRRWRRLAAGLMPGLLSLALAACAGVIAPPVPATPTAAGPVSISVVVDGQTQRFSLPQPMTVREALSLAGVAVGELDRIAPAPFTRLTQDTAIHITRIRETFETEQAVVPFTSEIIKNEGLPEGEQRLLQAGANGLEELTYRTTFEDGVQTDRSIVKRVFLVPPTTEIIMVGAQASFTIVPITGTLAYISAGNAWMMRGTSAQRLPLTTSGDLDGRIFDLSPDGQWLLFTRSVTDTAAPNFNTLWAISVTTGSQAQPVDLKVSNVLYAEWSPAGTVTPTLAYATAEKTNRAPGWQANNDLWTLSLLTNRRTRQVEITRTQIIDTNSGGVYGWWGTGYAYAPDGQSIAYARTDSIGAVDLAQATTTELARFTAYNSRSDWAWYPSLRWAEGGWLYTVTHGEPLGLELPEDSPVFDLTALSITDRLRLELVPRAGMFANPVPSPIQASAALTAERPARIAFLQAVDANNSPFSRYRLAVMDRDGSNLRALFPAEDQPGLEAGLIPTWSPDGRLIAIPHQGNLWLIDPDSGITQQLTGDGLSQKPDWSR